MWPEPLREVLKKFLRRGNNRTRLYISIVSRTRLVAVALFLPYIKWKLIAAPTAFK
jgi:hypothetical protein